MTDYRATAATVPELTLDVWRMAALALCEHACGYDKGRAKDDPVYREVTEGRDGPGPEQRKKYSSCGDLAHWMYKRLGIREPWLNRTDDGVFGNWVAGVNVSRLWGAHCPFDVVPPAAESWVPEAGDVLLTWNTVMGKDAHVLVVLDSPAPGRLRTANYGAGGMSAALSPGAVIREAAFWRSNGYHTYGHKRVQRFLPLAEAVRRLSAPPDLSGASLTGEVVDAVELGWEAYQRTG